MRHPFAYYKVEQPDRCRQPRWNPEHNPQYRENGLYQWTFKPKMACTGNHAQSLRAVVERVHGPQHRKFMFRTMH